MSVKSFIWLEEFSSLIINCQAESRKYKYAANPASNDLFSQNVFFAEVKTAEEIQFRMIYFVPIIQNRISSCEKEMGVPSVTTLLQRKAPP